MTDQGFDSSILEQLQSKHKDLLDDIDKLRSQGIGQYIDLPQIIVCGDQSSGKSSVLEAISRVRFPTKDDVCTRFATELILRRGPAPVISVSIKPGTGRSKTECDRLASFQSSFSSPSELFQVVETAKEYMGITDDASKNFSDDVLRVEVCGPKQPHLTLVDLPGIIHTAKSSDDIRLVRRLVESYMEKGRTIILAVVTAKTDAANQCVFELLKKHDPNGQRTMGIITKPDTLPQGTSSENKFLQLARNVAQPFRHGWHVLKNRDERTKDVSDTERDEAEAEFLSSGVWSNLQTAHKGAISLRRRLSAVLLSHITDSLPSLIDEINSARDLCAQDLKKLGDTRITTKEQRQYLVKVSGEFSKLVDESQDGHCKNRFFDKQSSENGLLNRLRSALNHHNTSFALEMYDNGHRRQFLSGGPVLGRPGSGAGSITHEDLIKELDNAAELTRGTWLPDFANAELVRTLFQDQCSPWQTIAAKHIIAIWNVTRSHLYAILDHIADPDTVIAVSKHLLEPWLAGKQAAMQAMLEMLIRPHTEGRPMTHVMRYMVYSLECHGSHQFEMMREILMPGIKAPSTPEKLFSMPEIQQAMDSVAKKDRYSSAHIIASTRAYYEIAIDHFIDNVTILGIEQCLIEDLKNVFNPDIVASMDENTLELLGGESEELRLERRRLEDKLKVLNLGLQTCSIFCSPVAAGRVLSRDNAIPNSTAPPIINEIPASEDPFVSIKESRSAAAGLTPRRDRRRKSRSSVGSSPGLRTTSSSWSSPQSVSPQSTNTSYSVTLDDESEDEAEQKEL